jgi:hypothetical protein
VRPVAVGLVKAFQNEKAHALLRDSVVDATLLRWWEV